MPPHSFPHKALLLLQDTKYEALIDQLDKYSKQGIPNNASYPTGQCPEVDALHNLEDDWREIVYYSGKSR